MNWSVIADNLGAYAEGARLTVTLTVASLAISFFVALPLAFARNSRRPWLRYAVLGYTLIFRGTPLLVQLFLIFYGLPSAGIVLDAFTAAVIGFTLNIGAYSSEIIRATLAAIPKGQWEAAYSIGMNWPQVMWRVILPQAARIAVPPLSNTFISLVKDTSLAAAVTVPELFQAAQRLASVTYEPLILYIETALIYLMFSSVLSTLQDRLEQRLAHKETREVAL